MYITEFWVYEKGSYRLYRSEIHEPLSFTAPFMIASFLETHLNIKEILINILGNLFIR